MIKTPVSVVFLWVVALVAVFAADSDASWAILNMTVLQNMTDMDYIYPHTPIFIGSPPQTVSMGVNLAGSLLAAWGNQLYDPTQSTTYINLNKPWLYATPEFNGPFVSDIIDFGGILNASQTEFVRVDDLSTDFPQRIHNGVLGLYVPPDPTAQSTNVFSRLWKQGKLLNPVMGFRFDPNKPRVTIGALDPSDYEGTINWVKLEQAEESWDNYNVIKIDGMKGYNESFIPWGSNLRASLSTIFRNIKVPNTATYLFNGNYTGPVNGTISIWKDGGVGAEFGYPCTLLANGTAGSTQYVALTVVINGVEYPIDSANNMARAPSLFSKEGVCNVAMQNKTNAGELPNPPEVILGMPFLRSVYVAYRFPTDDCPGYYGFAYPAGANRTEAQKAQKPSVVPTDSTKCLNLQPPTSMPFPHPFPSDSKISTSKYSVYGNDSVGQVPLVGWDELPREVWGGASGR